MAEKGFIQRVSTGATYNFLGIIMRIFIGLLYSILTVRWLAVQNFGIFSFLGIFFAIVGPLYSLGISSMLERFIPELIAKKDLPRTRRLIKIAARIKLAAGFLMFILMFFGAEFLAGLMGDPNLGFYIKLMSLSIIPGAISGLLGSVLHAFYEQKFTNLTYQLTQVINLILVFVLVGWLDLGLSGMILISTILAAITVTIYFIRIRQKHSDKVWGENRMIGKELGYRTRRYCISYMFIPILTYFLSNPSAAIFVGILGTMSAVTYFTIAYTLAQRVAGEIWGVIGNLALISLTEIKTKNPDKVKLALRQLNKFISIYTVPATIGGLFLAEQILSVLYGDQMLPAATPFRMLILAMGVSTILGTPECILPVLEKTTFILTKNCLAVLILFISSIILIPPYGVFGATIASLLLILFGLTVNICYIMKFVFYGHSFLENLSDTLSFKSLLKYAVSSLFEILTIITLSFFLQSSNAVTLGLTIIFGFLAYVAGIKITKAVDEYDKSLIYQSNIPLKRLILKFL